MGDDTYKAVAFCQTCQCVIGLAQGFRIQRAEAFIHEQGVQLDAGGHLDLVRQAQSQGEGSFEAFTAGEGLVTALRAVVMVDAKGNQLTEFRWSTIEKRYDGYTAVSGDYYYYGLIGENGDLIVEPKWAFIDRFDRIRKGLARVSWYPIDGIDMPGELGMIDEN